MSKRKGKSVGKSDEEYIMLCLAVWPGDTTCRFAQYGYLRYVLISEVNNPPTLETGP